MNAQPLEEYLVQHGQGGFLGRFRNRTEQVFQHGDAVVVQSPRGLEMGMVMSAAPARFAALVDPDTSGAILRAPTARDTLLAQQYSQQSRALVEKVQQRVEEHGYPLTILDGEILLDGENAVIQAIHWDACDATPLFEELSRESSLKLRLHDLSTAPAAPAKGCGAEGCGAGNCSSCGSSEGGGCSTGSCSSGKVKSAEELTEYFAALRAKMPTSARMVPLH
jgi:cell fate regulator YaaT (PSP1 superfamily)